jgi:Xaa-Pro dipeptidase
MLQPAPCRQRQRRLLDVMRRERLDTVVLSSAHHVYYFTAYRPFWLHEAALVLRGDGRATLVCGKTPDAPPAADEVLEYESNWMGTQRQEQPALVAELVGGLSGGLPPGGRLGVDASAVASQLAMRLDAAPRAVDPHLWQLRRQKDPDELDLMRRAVACTEAMYRRAREIIEPGVPEVRVYAELHAAAVEVAGEPLAPAYLGNDYACGAPGGPPRGGRAAAAGELYVLDLGPAYRGYFSDSCRTFAVDRKPTDAQLKAWHVVTGVHPIVERMARPGVRCRDLYAAADEHYRAATGQPFPHHLGHGVGLQPHEFPHLNPRWDDVLAEGEVFTAEPGMYGPELNAGMRIENQYLVTATGVENLTPFPTGLA